MTNEQDMALEDLENGHAVITVESAEKLSTILGQTLDPKIILSWSSGKEAREHYGIFPNDEGPGGGVGMLELGYSLCEQLGIDPPPGHTFSGKGYQARANAEALRSYFAQKNDEEKQDD